MRFPVPSILFAMALVALSLPRFLAANAALAGNAAIAELEAGREPGRHGMERAGSSRRNALFWLDDDRYLSELVSVELTGLRNGAGEAGRGAAADTAVDLARSAVSRAPGEADAWYLLALAAATAGMPDLAAGAIEGSYAAAAFHPQVRFSRVHLGLLLAGKLSGDARAGLRREMDEVLDSEPLRLAGLIESAGLAEAAQSIVSSTSPTKHPAFLPAN